MEEEKTEETEVTEDEKIEEAAEKLYSAFAKKMEKSIEDSKAKEIEKPVEAADEKMLVTKFGSIERDKIVSRKKGFEGSDEDFVKVGEFVKALISNDKQKLQIMVEGSDALGGFLVPEEWANTIIEKKEEMTVIRPRATVVPVQTNVFHLPQLATKPKVYWRSEAATKSTSTFGLEEITLTPYSLAVIVPLSQELVDDATVGLPGSIINWVAQLIAKEVAKEEDKVFAGTWGTGTGRPTGIATYAGIKEIAAANALSGDHIIGAFYGLGSGYRSNAYWIMSSETMSIVQGLKDDNNRYLFNDALTAGGLPTLKGRPVLEHNNLGIASIYFGDISAYWIADRTGIRVRVSDEATVASNSAFEKNLVYVRVEERVDGELADTAAFVEITNAK
jgi:HK97 family phage major capsid protein